MNDKPQSHQPTSEDRTQRVKRGVIAAMQAFYEQQQPEPQKPSRRPRPVQPDLFYGSNERNQDKS